jgi:hypothetical protein
VATRQALIDQHRCVILATNAREAALWSPPEVRHGDTGQAQAARGCRCLNDPPFVAASCSRNKPERMMALVLVMTVCLLG